MVGADYTPEILEGSYAYGNGVETSQVYSHLSCSNDASIPVNRFLTYATNDGECKELKAVGDIIVGVSVVHTRHNALGKFTSTPLYEAGDQVSFIKEIEGKRFYVNVDVTRGEACYIDLTNSTVAKRGRLTNAPNNDVNGVARNKLIPNCHFLVSAKAEALAITTTDFNV